MKKLLLLLFLLVCGSFIYFSVQTYALFETNRDYVASNNLARWTVEVNENEAVTTENFIVDTLNILGNEYVIANKIAPGISYYFDIIINPNNTEVSLRYDLMFDFSGLSSDGLVVTSVSEIGGNTLTTIDNNTYAGVISLEDIENSVTHTIRVSISWNDDTLNNEQDSLIGATHGNVISIPVNVKLSQYLGETL